MFIFEVFVFCILPYIAQPKENENKTCCEIESNYSDFPVIFCLLSQVKVLFKSTELLDGYFAGYKLLQ